MGYFTEKVKIEKRGSIGGLILLLSGLIMSLLGMLSAGDIFLQTIILGSWRLLGLVAFLLLKIPKEPVEKRDIAYREVVTQRSFILYFVPWLMFALITFLTVPIQAELFGKSTVDYLMLLESALLGVFALVGGFLADIVGRKRMAITGFALLGFGYSILGIFSQEAFSIYIYTIIDGVALGLLYVVFVMTIWGDLSPGQRTDKYYALGVLPFFISKYIEYVAATDFATKIPDTEIFSFTAFFLFIAVLPLVYAPETLPEKVMRDRDLKSYVEKAQKKAAKEGSSGSKTEKQKGSPPSESEEDAEFEEARELAEKYY
jgi:MFS family permease